MGHHESRSTQNSDPRASQYIHMFRFTSRANFSVEAAVGAGGQRSSFCALDLDSAAPSISPISRSIPPFCRTSPREPCRKRRIIGGRSRSSQFWAQRAPIPIRSGPDGLNTDPSSSYMHQAAFHYLGDNVEYRPCSSISCTLHPNSQKKII